METAFQHCGIDFRMRVVRGAATTASMPLSSSSILRKSVNVRAVPPALATAVDAASARSGSRIADALPPGIPRPAGFEVPRPAVTDSDIRYSYSLALRAQDRGRGAE